jgi:lipopolysaccharide biosynthesis glycosyltransferase
MANIISAIDKNYIWPFAVSLYSRRVYAQEDHVYFLAYLKDSIPLDLLDELEIFAHLIDVNLQFLPLEIPEKNLRFLIESTNDKLFFAGYLKLVLLDCFADDFLWLDSDTLCLRGWEEIFTYQKSLTKDIFVIGALDSSQSELTELHQKNSAFSKAGSYYFNSGVMLCSPGAWRKRFQINDWIDIVKNREVLGFHFKDQDVLNFLSNGSRTFLASEYNQLSGRSATVIPKILHYTGANLRPWDFNNQDQLLEYIYRDNFLFHSRTENQQAIPVLGKREYQDFYWKLEKSLLGQIKLDSKQIPQLMNYSPYNRPSKYQKNFRFRIKIGMLNLALFLLKQKIFPNRTRNKP